MFIKLFVVYSDIILYEHNHCIYQTQKEQQQMEKVQQQSTNNGVSNINGWMSSGKFEGIKSRLNPGLWFRDTGRYQRSQLWRVDNRKTHRKKRKHENAFLIFGWWYFYSCIKFNNLLASKKEDLTQLNK
jgi:hypothetical protein